MKKWLFNPFVYIAGARALVIGIAIMLATACVGYYSHAHFDGVIDVHVGRVMPLQAYFWEQLVDWGCIVLLFYVAGLLFSKSKIRFIDIAGTMALARWVMLFVVLIAFGVKPFPLPFPSLQTSQEATSFITRYTATILLGLLMVPFTIWMIALMYNAFRVSCNMKGGKTTAVFIVTLIIAEITASVILHHLYKHFI